MKWGWFILWVVVILLLFFVTGWPVQATMTNVWGNHYDAKDLTYYTILYFHYLLGGLFFSFLGLGLFRDIIWNPSRVQGSNRQIAFLLAYSMLIASVAAIVLVHKYSPVEETSTTPAPVTDDGNSRQLDLVAVGPGNQQPELSPVPSEALQEKDRIDETVTSHH